MSLLPKVQLPDDDKLQILQRLDQFRDWRSLEDKRYCIACGTLINGHRIQVVGGSRGNGPLRVICPTVRCNSIPMDWVLPTDEVLARNSIVHSGPMRMDLATTEPQVSKRSFGESLRKFAAHLRRRP